MTRLTKPSSPGITVLKITPPGVVSTSSVRVTVSPSSPTGSVSSSSTLTGACTCTWPSCEAMITSAAEEKALPAPFSSGASTVR